MVTPIMVYTSEIQKREIRIVVVLYISLTLNPQHPQDSRQLKQTIESDI